MNSWIIHGFMDYSWIIHGFSRSVQKLRVPKKSGARIIVMPRCVRTPERTGIRFGQAYLFFLDSKTHF